MKSTIKSTRTKKTKTKQTRITPSYIGKSTVPSLTKKRTKMTKNTTSLSSKRKYRNLMAKQNVINKLLQQQVNTNNGNINNGNINNARNQNQRWMKHSPKKISTIVNFFEQMAISKGSQLVDMRPGVYSSKPMDKKTDRYPFYENALIKSLYRLIAYNKIKVDCCSKDFSLKVVGIRGNNRKKITENDLTTTIFEVSTKPDQIQTVNMGCRLMLYKKENKNSNNYPSSMHPNEVCINLCNIFNNLLFQNKTQNLLFHFKDFKCNNFFSNNKIIPSISKCKNKKGVIKKRMCELRKFRKNNTIENKAIVCLQELGTMNMHDWITYENPSLIEWKSVLFQLLHCVHVLQTTINGFMHNHLSTKHIIMCECQKGGVFIYKLNNKTYYVPNVGWIPKIIPSNYSHVSGMFDNRHVFDPEIQINLEIDDTYDMTSDVHYLINRIFNYQETNNEIKNWCLKKYGVSYLMERSIHVSNYRKRKNISHSKSIESNTPKKLIKSSLFKSFKKKNNKSIVLYPRFN